MTIFLSCCHCNVIYAIIYSVHVTNDFEQAGQRYRSLDKVDQDHLVDNIADDLGKADKPIQKCMVDNLTKADSEFGKRVAKI